MQHKSFETDFSYYRLKHQIHLILHLWRENIVLIEFYVDYKNLFSFQQAIHQRREPLEYKQQEMKHNHVI